MEEKGKPLQFCFIYNIWYIIKKITRHGKARLHNQQLREKAGKYRSPNVSDIGVGGKNLENYYYYIKGCRGKVEQNRWTHGEFHQRIQIHK